MIRIIAVGKIKEKYLEAAIAEYSKRIGAYTRLQIVRVADEKCPETFSEAQVLKVKEREGRRILEQISDRDYVITLEIQGQRMSSEEFSSHLEGLMVSGRSDIAFVIGGSAGLSGEVSARSDLKLSFSEMTFPHQLMRVILLEQIYRAYKIARKEPYHK